jgi:hypothetical protein
VPPDRVSGVGFRVFALKMAPNGMKQSAFTAS